MKEAKDKKLDVVEMLILRWMCGITNVGQKKERKYGKSMFKVVRICNQEKRRK